MGKSHLHQVRVFLSQSGFSLFPGSLRVYNVQIWGGTCDPAMIKLYWHLLSCKLFRHLDASSPHVHGTSIDRSIPPIMRLPQLLAFSQLCPYYWQLHEKMKSCCSHTPTRVPHRDLCLRPLCPGTLCGFLMRAPPCLNSSGQFVPSQGNENRSMQSPLYSWIHKLLW